MVDLRSEIWQRYVLVSHLLLACCFGHVTLHSTGFFEVIQFFAKSKTCMLILYNYTFMIFALLCFLPVLIFLGRLSALELEQLQEGIRNYVMDAVIFILLSKPRINGSELPIGLLMKYLTLLVAMKSFHILMNARLSTMFQMEVPSYISVVRLSTFIYLMTMVDCRMLFTVWNGLKWKDTFTVWLVFEICGMITICAFSTLRYLLNLLDYFYENGLQNKTTLSFYLELLHDFLSLASFSVFMAIFYFHNPNTMPAYMIIDIFHVVRNLSDRISMLMQYHSVVDQIETRFPKPTQEERGAEETCIICRDTFDDDARKIDCGHIFHLTCLKSWLFQHSTCPTCRAPIHDNAQSQVEEVDLNRIFLNAERRIRRLGRRVTNFVMTTIGRSQSQKDDVPDPKDVQKFIESCSSHLMEPVLAQLEGKRLVCQFSIKSSSTMQKSDDARVDTTVPQNADDSNGQAPNDDASGLNSSIEVDSLAVKSQTLENQNSPTFKAMSSECCITQAMDDVETQLSSSQNGGENNDSAQVHGLKNSMSSPERKTRRRLRDALRFWRRASISPDDLDITDNSESPASKDMSHTSDSSIKGDGKVVSDDSKDVSNAEGACGHVSSSEGEIINEAVNDEGESTQQNTSDGDLECTEQSDDSLTSKLVLPDWVRLGCIHQSDKDRKAKAGLLKLLKKLNMLKHKLAVLSKVEEDEKSLKDAASSSKTNAFTQSDSAISQNVDNGIEATTDSALHTMSHASSSSASIRQIRIAKLSGDKEQNPNSLLQEKEMTTQSPKHSASSVGSCVTNVSIHAQGSSDSSSLFINATQEIEVTDNDDAAKTVSLNERGDSMTSHTKEEGSSIECQLVSSNDTDLLESNMETNSIASVPKEGATTTLASFNGEEGIGKSISHQKCDDSCQSPEISNENNVVASNPVASSDAKTVGTTGKAIQPSAGGSVSDEGTEALNALLNELNNFDLMSSCDILLKSDDACDAAFFASLDSMNMPEYRREFFVSYGKMIRMWLLTLEGLSRTHEKYRRIFNTVNAQRFSNATVEAHRNILTNAASTIKCSEMSKEALKSLHDDFMKNSFTYQDGLWRLCHSEISMDFMEHMIATVALMDTIIKSELEQKEEQ